MSRGDGPKWGVKNNVRNRIPGHEEEEVAVAKEKQATVSCAHSEICYRMQHHVQIVQLVEILVMSLDTRKGIQEESMTP